MAATDYRSGSSGILYYAPETAPYPAITTAANSNETPPAPAFPSTGVFWGGAYTDVPTVTIDDGTREVYGLGSNAAQTIIPGGRVVSMDTSFHLANKVFLQKCFYGSGGYRNLADLCLVDGYSNEFGDGVSHAIRFAKCNSGSVTMGEGSAQDIMVSAQFWGLAQEEGSVFTPSAADLQLFGTPLNWHNVTQVNIGTFNVRNVISSLTLNWSHNLERKGFRPDYGVDQPWSRTAYALLPRQRQYSAELTFHTPDAAAAVLNLLNSQTATGAFSIVATDAGSSIQNGAARSFTFAAAAGRIRSRTRRGGAPSEEMMGTVSLALLGVSVS